MASALTTPEARTGKKHWLDGWHVVPSVNRDYDFIDGLRGVAILMVAVSHHFYINPDSGVLTHYIGAVIGSGSHGVILFYALSGFLISWAFWKRKASNAEQVMPKGYSQRRFWKIYPPLALAVFLLTPFYIFWFSDWSYLAIGAKWLAGLPFIMPVEGKFNPVMWTLVIEVQFYITLPFLFLCLKRVSPRATLVAITMLFLFVPLLFRIITGQHATFSPYINSHYPAALDAFCFGILIAGLENLGFIKKSWVRWGLAGIVLWPLAIVLAAWVSLQPTVPSFAATEWVEGSFRFAAACLLLFIAQPQHAVARLLCAPWLRWFGIISYEWYLLHQPFVLWARSHFGPANGNATKFLLIIGIPFIVSLIGSAAVYRFFSLPILRFGRDKHRH